jgi:uncharacterized DUF497 family protein
MFDPAFPRSRVSASRGSHLRPLSRLGILSTRMNSKQCGLLVAFSWRTDRSFPPSRDDENQTQHGVSFAKAQLAFADTDRVIAEDLSHSVGEQRYYSRPRATRTTRTRAKARRTG